MIKEAKQYRYCCLKKNSFSTMMKIGKASRTECAEVKDLAHRKKGLASSQGNVRARGKIHRT